MGNYIKRAYKKVCMLLGQSNSGVNGAWGSWINKNRLW